MFNVLSKQLQDTLTTAFERHFKVEDSTEVYQHALKSIMDQHTCKTYVQPNSFLAKQHETKIEDGACKTMSWTKSQVCTLKNIQPK